MCCHAIKPSVVSHVAKALLILWKEREQERERKRVSGDHDGESYANKQLVAIFAKCELIITTQALLTQWGYNI